MSRSKVRLKRNDLQFRDFGRYKAEITMLIVFVLFCLLMSLASPFFMTRQNLLNVLTQISVNAVLAIGMTFVILTAGIDLSVGGSLGLSAMVSGIVMKDAHSVGLGILCALLVGLFIGVVNGFLIGYMKMPAFIVTLGVMQICKSLTYVISDGHSQSGFPEGFAFIGQMKIGGLLPFYAILTLLMYIIFIFVLNRAKFGRFLYAVGSNAEAARLSGIRIGWVIMRAYLLSGLLGAVAGIIMVSRMMAVDPTYGKDAEMDAIAAVVIGGTSMMGGKGTLVGTMIGVCLVGFLRNALNLLGINPFWQGSAVGLVIIAAVLTEKLSSKRGRSV